MTDLAFSGADVDGGLYTRVTDLAAHAPGFVDRLVADWTDYGLAVFAVLMLGAWWYARGQSTGRMAQALLAPVVVVLVYAVNDVLKGLVQEQRPCQTLPGSSTIEACPGAGDWSFPSNHSVIAAAAATAVFLVHRALGWVAAVAALAMAASRVWVGVHYPHDVLVALLLGVAVAWPLTVAAGHAAPAVERLRASRWRVAVARR
ncbi:phosphatase PAP2 family protein [Yinghuangia aomiensis]|uniref:Phosphatase PAP2 family protein n=1 Tax=Yinghuangia aomiensis TaxID=676205 RepID=A0ABP9I838_9ACTN